MSPPSLPSPFGIGGRWGPQAAPRGAQPNPRSRWGPPMVPRPPQQQQPRFTGQQQPGFAGQQQPGFAGQQPGFTGQQQPGFAGQQQSGFTGQQQPGFNGPTGTQGWQVPWGGQPMMQGWGPQGGQPPFPLGSGGSQIGQLNPLYDITGGFLKKPNAWWILGRAEETTCHGSSSNPLKNVMVGESRW